MVKIAVAGGTGQVAQEVVDALVASKKHEITILSRGKAPTAAVAQGVKWRAVDYNDKSALVEALRGMHTVLSFVQLLSDPDQTSQKNPTPPRKELHWPSPLLTRGTGHPFAVEKLKVEDLEAGELKASWGLEAVHSAVTDDQARAMLKAVCIGTLLSSSRGAWGSSDEMNQLFPDYEFAPVEGFLSKVWEGKP